MAEMYQIEVRHPGLNKYRMIRGRDMYDVRQRASILIAEWDDMWARKQDKENKVREKEEKIAYAAQLTKEAEASVREVENLLKFTLNIDDRIDWEKLKDRTPFPENKPNVTNIIKLQPQPDRNETKYNPQKGILDKLFKGRWKKKIENTEAEFKKDVDLWETTRKDLAVSNRRIVEENKKRILDWEEGQRKYYELQENQNNKVDEMKSKYLEMDPATVAEYCELVLKNSKYPSFFLKEYEVEYTHENKMLIINYSLPYIGDIPKLKEVKYIQSRDQFTEVYIKESQTNNLYDDLVYQVTLRTIHEVFEADMADAVDIVVFNGWVSHVDDGTGTESNVCIASLQTSKKEFLSINLEKIDPKSCFRKLKGIGSARIHSITPIAPIINLNREDKRFVTSYQIAHTLNEGVNIAAMGWEDFEHLIREIFEKEFSQQDNEVKITRASRDGGVDAVVFDSDPIRGGKIVIQAKRYTNTVGVSAVRDLYGTVVNEGAIKGILVTTADYGPDAYEFAKGKPLTLLNGGNLLHLLQKHGHKSHIDLKDAKRLLLEKEGAQ